MSLVVLSICLALFSLWHTHTHPSSWSSGCLHWPWLSSSLVPLSLFLGRNLFYIEFFLCVVHELKFFYFIFQDVWEEWRYVCVLTVLWVKVRMCRNACEWACGRGENFFFCLTSCVRAGMTQFALVVAVILKCSTFLAVISSIRQSASFSLLLLFFPLTSLLSSLYWPWDPLSSLESTPVSI